MVQKIQSETFELLKNIGKSGKMQTLSIKSFTAMGSRISELPIITQKRN